MQDIARDRVIGLSRLITHDMTRMKHLFTHFDTLFPRGFTLIELMVVFALMGIIVTGGVVSYSSYNKKQGLQMGAADVVNMLTSAKAKAISQVKPSACAGRTLNGYQVRVTKSGADYSLQAVCGGTSYPISSKKLPQDVTFGSGSLNTIFFTVSSGNSSTPGNVILNSGTAAKTINISGSGAIRSQ